jgi:predicted nucleotidyltransferase
MVSRRDIKRFSNEIARRFKPEKIILFGSHAYGKPTADSDVDLLLVMPCKRRPLDQALEIRLTSKNKRSEE